MALRAVGGDTLLYASVKPNRAESALLGVRARPGRGAGEMVWELEIALAAPPLDGAANAELIALLARSLRVPKRNLTLEAGANSRHKVVRICGAKLSEVRAALESVGCRLKDHSGC